MSRARDTPKIGQGHLAAMGRQGLREIRAAFYAESNIAQQPDYGLVGMATPGEVAESRRDEARDLEEERGSVLEDRLQVVNASRDVRGRDDKSKDFDKE